MFELPKLPYAYDALEPYIDAQTMETHYTKHHQGYTNKLNTAIAWAERENKTIEEILTNLDNLPAEKKSAIINNGGGYYNHNLFWNIMCPANSSDTVMSENFANILTETFWSVENFKEQFSNSAATNFGSGRTWLVKDENNNLKILNTANQDCPISQGLIPILGLDVWEHAYYLKYQNKRPEYIQNWWNVVNWKAVEERYNQ